MSITNEINAVTRLLKFDNIEVNGRTKILKLTKKSYYKIFFKETSSTNIVEVLNGKIYSMCSSSEKGFLLTSEDEFDILHISNFDKFDLLIDFYEEFELINEESDKSEEDIVIYNTQGIINYLENFRAQKFEANEVQINTIIPNVLTCNTIRIGNWDFESGDNGDVIIKLNGASQSTGGSSE